MFRVCSRFYALFLFFFLCFRDLPAGDLSIDAIKPSPRPLPKSLFDFAALQLSLDNEGFSPGLIDGRKGNRTTQAIRLAREAERPMVPLNNPWAIWKVPPDFFKDLAPVPESWVTRSKMSALNHETPLERLSEKFHTSQAFFKLLNPDIHDWSKLPKNLSLKVPALNPIRLPRADHLNISLSRKVIMVCDAEDRIFASFPCSIAAKKEKRPVGTLTVKVLASRPDYLFDPSTFPENPESATISSKLLIPPGPNNPVGDMWIGLSLKGYGIHGTPFPEDIGKTESHGCFRMTNWDAKRLGMILRIGTPVTVTE